MLKCCIFFFFFKGLIYFNMLGYVMLACISTQKDSECCCCFFCEHFYTLIKLTLIYLFDNKILKCILLFCIVSTVNIINNLFAFFVIYLFFFHFLLI